MAETKKSNIVTFHHADLGSMTGLITPDNVVQFRGIPFATVPARFKQSILLHTLSDSSEREFTKFG